MRKVRVIGSHNKVNKALDSMRYCFDNRVAYNPLIGGGFNYFNEDLNSLFYEPDNVPYVDDDVEMEIEWETDLEEAPHSGEISWSVNNTLTSSDTNTTTTGGSIEF